MQNDASDRQHALLYYSWGVFSFTPEDNFRQIIFIHGKSFMISRSVVFVWNKENQHNRFNKKALYANGAHEHWAMTEHSPFGDKRPPPPYHLQMEVLWEENGRTQVADSERGHVANELHRREEIWVIFCSQRKANTSLSHSALLLQLPHFYVSSPCRVT